MSDAKTLIREWIDLMAVGPAEGWTGKAASDVVVKLPYAPPGVAAEMHGFEMARDTLGHHWSTKSRFEWRDVTIRQTEDPELYVTTATSDATMTSGAHYANSYVMLTRVRGGVIVEHTEYFNPLPIIDLLAAGPSSGE